MNPLSISVIIPIYNNAKTLRPLLDSLRMQTEKPHEVIVVDDCSTDESLSIVASHEDVRIVRLEQNSGPAAARNRGAKSATGEVLFFLDSDVVLPVSAVQIVRKTFIERPTIHAINGVMEKEPLNPNCFTRYKAMTEYTWGQNIPDWDDSSRCINARVGAVRRSSFFDIGGFNEGYKKPSVEDHEFGLRFAQKYRITLCKELTAYHNFSGFYSTCKNYFNRTSELLQLKWINSSMNVLDKGGASNRVMIEFLCAFFALCSLPLLLTHMWPVSLSLFLLFILLSAKSLRLHLQYGGIFFYLVSLVLEMIYGSIVVIAGGVTFVSLKLFKRQTIPDLLQVES